MCGIWGLILHKAIDEKFNRLKKVNHYECFKRISHRGPDMSVFQSFRVGDNNVYLGFHRLAIIDVAHGNQPFIYEKDNRKVYLLCNGEIYNYKKLIEKYNLQTKSDCHVVLDLYIQYGKEKVNNLLQEIEGEFAFVLIDFNIETNDMSIIMVRDRFGIRPLFYTRILDEKHQGYAFCSEMKGIMDYGKVFQFLPRMIQINDYITDTINWNEYKLEYYRIEKKTNKYELFDIKDIQRRIRDTLIESVRVRLQSERPVGALLSGGLDSSLIASIASDILKKEGKKLKTFAIGMNDSPDLHYARIVSKWIDSEHHEIIIPPEVWLKTIEKVIEQIETYDMTTIRASTGQYLLGKWISENSDIKVLLNGDGSDELCSGYMYFYNAPDSLNSHEENIWLLNEIHFYDVLRVDRGISGNGLEARVPFLDHHFVDLYLSIPFDLRHPIKGERMEKQLLRDSFKESGLLPDEVLYRKKEAFSDGVSSMKKSWFQMIEELQVVKNVEFREYYYLKPKTKEGYYYRNVFDRLYPNQSQILSTNHFWLPKWSGDIVNPSARVLNVYNE